VAGVTGIETAGLAGLRMTSIPPDWALEDVLGVLRAMQEIGIALAPITRWRVAS
jgi:hypothetical protein